MTTSNNAVIFKLPPHNRLGKSIADNSWMDTVERFIANAQPVGPYANDAAAAAAGVPLKGLYYDSATPAVVHIRLV